MERTWPTLNPLFDEALATYRATHGWLPAGDVATRRVNSPPPEVPLQPVPGVRVEDATAVSADGAEVPLLVFTPQDASGAGYVYIHGGGLIMGTIAATVEFLSALAADTGLTIVTPEYRLAPDVSYPTPLDDCFAALLWTAEQAPRLGIDPERLAVGGMSAGGGLAAAVCQRARDEGGPRVSAQVLECPMLDVATVGRPTPAGATWTYDDNETGWRAYLGADYGAESTPRYAVPGRTPDLAGLPRTFVSTSTLDVFCDEDVAFAQRLWQAGVSCELHVYPDVPHAFEDLVPDAPVSVQSRRDRTAFLRTI